MADELTTQSVPEPPRGPRRRARDALVVVFLSVVVLVLFEGSSVRQAGDDLRPGFQRDVVRTVGEPAGCVADRLPFDEWGDDALAFLEDEGAGAGAGFDEGGAPTLAPCPRSRRTPSIRPSWAPSPSLREHSTRCS